MKERTLILLLSIAILGYLDFYNILYILKFISIHIQQKTISIINCIVLIIIIAQSLLLMYFTLKLIKKLFIKEEVK